MMMLGHASQLQAVDAFTTLAQMQFRRDGWDNRTLNSTLLNILMN